MEKKRRFQFFALCFCLGILAASQGLFAETVSMKTETKDSKILLETSTKGLDLGQLFRYYGSDKDSNGYTSVYHTLFNHLKEKCLMVLEIGIGTMIPNVPSSMVGYSRPGYKPGGSLRAWRDYFEQSTIYGVDIQPDTQFSDEPRIITRICDSTSGENVREFMKNLGDIKFDIIIDDGSHLDTHQLKTLANFYPYLREGGMYVIEDIYPGSGVSGRPDEVSRLCNRDPLFFVGIKNNIAIIYKQHLNRDGCVYSF